MELLRKSGVKKYFYLPSFPSSLLINIIFLSFSVRNIGFLLSISHICTIQEVQQYQTAIEHIAQTGLRDTIGKHELSELLQERDKIAEDLQQVLDRNTNPWGITCQTVGIKDIAIPKDLAEAMSKEAQAERERRARVILGTAETEIAEKFAQASRKYTDNPVALHLRGMDMLFEGLKEKGSMVIVPSSALDTMNLGAMGGLVSLAKNNETPQKPVAATVPQA